ncbi:MAG: hypothetical protein COT25_00820, partial [Candidatus Kerfeldbacteria bacterium CG08_land_8_20_14_0_20_42_7]
MSEKSGDLIDVTTGWVNLTTKCNNRCAWCYRSEDFLAPPEVMSLSLAHQVVDFFGKLGIYSCIFIGGEPTLYPGLPKLIRQAKICGIPEITVVSNGRKYKHRDYVRMLAAEGLDHFSISIHSSDRESHNSICGTSSWDDTIQGIQNVVAEGYRCTLNLIAGRRNYDSVLES